LAFLGDIRFSDVHVDLIAHVSKPYLITAIFWCTEESAIGLADIGSFLYVLAPGHESTTESVLEEAVANWTTIYLNEKTLCIYIKGRYYCGNNVTETSYIKRHTKLSMKYLDSRCV